MILNESKVKVNDMKVFSSSERSLGLFFCFIDLFFISSVKVSNKIMVNKKVFNNVFSSWNFFLFWEYYSKLCYNYVL